MEDVKKDFEKDNNFQDIEKKKIRNVYKKANREIATLLKEYL